MDDIRVDVGVYTTLDVDLTQFDFTGVNKVVFTVKNGLDPSFRVVLEKEFEENKVHQINITPEESRRMKDGAVYDFNMILSDGKRHKVGDNGKIILRRGVGNA